eukprot:6235377-Pyramimonas_sp.AAC.2
MPGGEGGRVRREGEAAHLAEGVVVVEEHPVGKVEEGVAPEQVKAHDHPRREAALVDPARRENRPSRRFAESALCFP